MTKKPRTLKDATPAGFSFHDPDDIPQAGPPEEMHREMQRWKAEHEAVCEAIGFPPEPPMAGPEPDEDDDDYSDFMAGEYDDQ